MVGEISKLKALLSFRPGKPTLIICGSILAVFVLVTTRPDKAPEPSRERAWSIEVMPAKPGSLSPTVELFGNVQSFQDAELSAGIEAEVTSMLVRDGQSVSEGELLASLDDRDTKLALAENDAELKETNAQYSFARIKLERSKQASAKEQELLVINEERARRAEEIFQEGLLSRADLDTANENLARQQLAINIAQLAVEENKAKLIEYEARIARAKALRERSALDLERAQIIAPFSGIVSGIQVSVGDRVRTGDPLFRLQNPDALEIRAQLPSRLARTVIEGMQEGQTIPTAIAIDGGYISGKVVRVSGQTREGSGGVDSFIEFTSAPAALRPGSTVRVLIELPPENNVIAIPGEAVYGRNTIYKLDNDRLKMITVDRVGEREFMDGRTEVLVRTPLLVETDSIVTTKLSNAADGLLVSVKPENLASDEGETTTADNQ